MIHTLYFRIPHLSVSGRLSWGEGCSTLHGVEGSVVGGLGVLKSRRYRSCFHTHKVCQVTFVTVSLSLPDKDIAMQGAGEGTSVSFSTRVQGCSGTEQLRFEHLGCLEFSTGHCGRVSGWEPER